MEEAEARLQQSQIQWTTTSTGYAGGTDGVAETVEATRRATSKNKEPT